MTRNIIVISGPSGCGKSTLIHLLFQEGLPELRFSVSHTTRPPRPGEAHGRDYYFVTAARFARMARGKEFAEWAEVHGHCYGTSWREIRAKSGPGRTLVLDVDVQGARSIKEKFPEAMAILIVPPTLAALKQRLLRRQSRLDSEGRLRLGAALKELRSYALYDYVIVNDKVPAALAGLRCLVSSFRLRTARNSDKVKKLLRKKK